MKYKIHLSALLCYLGFLAFPAQAVITCPQTPEPVTASNAHVSKGSADVARMLAGVELPNQPSSPVFSQYAATVSAVWQPYLQNLGQPLHAWAAREVRQQTARTVFYPFSGPDLPTLLAVYPAATHFVMIADQYANSYFDPFSLQQPEQNRVLLELGESWARFGRQGFFVTQELNRGGGQRRLRLTPSMILMAFAARLGYEVASIRPTCLNAADLSIRPLEAKDAPWSSVRLHLRKYGRDIIVDYIQQDLSDRGLNKLPEAKALIEALTREPVLLKAASHLPQHPGFTVIRNAILANAPMVVQDETGLEYDDMTRVFNVRLYGEYVGAHRLFKGYTNPTLVKAYKERAKDVLPLGFRLGYQKQAGSAIQVSTRR